MSKFSKSSFIVLVSIILLLLALRLSAPYAIEKGVNYTLKTTPGLRGEIGDVDLALYRGAYQINDIELFLIDGGLEKPLMKVKRLDISVLWAALFRGSVVAEMQFLEPQFYYADNKNKEQEINEDASNEKTWVSLANRLVPFSIDRVDILNGRIKLETIATEQTSVSQITRVNGLISNITNSKDHSGSLVTNMQVEGMIEGVCPLQISGSIDPYASKPTFNFDVEMQRLPVEKIDGLIAFYAPFDVEAGELDFAMELAAEQGKVDGFVKAGVYDLSVFEWHDDVQVDGDNPFQWLFEALTGGIAGLFEDNTRDLIATEIPLTGQIDNIETPLWPAIYGIIKNAFIESLDITVEDEPELKTEPNVQTESENN